MASISKPILIFCPSQDLPDIRRVEDGAIFVARKLSKPVVFHRGWRRREIRVLGEDVFQRVSSFEESDSRIINRKHHKIHVKIVCSYWTKYWIIAELNWFVMSNFLRWAPKPGTTKGRFACRWICRLELKKIVKISRNMLEPHQNWGINQQEVGSWPYFCWKPQNLNRVEEKNGWI